MKSLRIALFFMLALLALPQRSAALDASELISYFVDQLSPYGRWTEQAPYGRVWEPSRVDSDWRPYSEGRWEYTDEYGWLWQPDEEWGQVTYHYGRWANRHGRWFWVPDDTWGPAWVDWRENEDYIGWAPLPPEADWRWNDEWRPDRYDYEPASYVFVPHRNFAEGDVRRYALPPRENRAVYERVRPMTVYRTVNNRVVNTGPRREDLERSARRQIKPVHYEPRSIHGKALPAPVERHERRRDDTRARMGAAPNRSEDLHDRNEALRNENRVLQPDNDRRQEQRRESERNQTEERRIHDREDQRRDAARQMEQRREEERRSNRERETKARQQESERRSAQQESVRRQEEARHVEASRRENAARINQPREPEHREVRQERSRGNEDRGRAAAAPHRPPEARQNPPDRKDSKDENPGAEHRSPAARGHENPGARGTHGNHGDPAADGHGREQRS